MGYVPVICDSGTSGHISGSSTRMFNYRESNETMQTVSGDKCPIQGYGDLRITLRYRSDDVHMLL